MIIASNQKMLKVKKHQLSIYTITVVFAHIFLKESRISKIQKNSNQKKYAEKWSNKLELMLCLRCIAQKKGGDIPG